MAKLRVALVSTAAVDTPGSMRVYADLLLQALQRDAPEIEASLVELDPYPGGPGWRQRLATLALPWRARRVASLKPQLWHILDGSRAYLAKGLRGAPVVITAHDIIPVLQQQGRFPGAPAVGAAARWLWKRNGKAMRAAASLVCVSERTLLDVSTVYGAPRQASVVQHPVRPALAALDTHEDSVRETGLVLHVGNNGFYKNRAQVLHVFAAMDRALAQRLVMVGPPPVPALRELSRQLGIAPSVQWLEDVDDAQVAHWYQRASVLVFPSLYEGYGWPVLEAMAFGLPVVTSHGGSLPEVVGDVAPCLAPDDVDGFVREMAAILADPNLAALRAARGRERAGQFTMARFAREMAAVYQAAVTGNPGGLH